MIPRRDHVRAVRNSGERVMGMAVDRGNSIVAGGASRYQVLSAHAKGGLGEVFLAEDSELHRRVALKEIQPEHAQNRISRERFVAEAEITGNLEHPGIVPVYGLGTNQDGLPFYTMRFIRGEVLTTAIRRFHAGPRLKFTGLEFRWLLRKLVDVCNTVAYAHSRGVLHRDLKPGNIMIGPFGETLVMDWGVAKLFGRSEGSVDRELRTATGSDEIAIRRENSDGSATTIGQAVGTPAYMSPEQASGALDALGPSSDVYSLGATLYVMLTDRRPFEGDLTEVLQSVREGRWQPARQWNPRIPRALDAICRRAMARAPAERYPSAAAMAVDIERWLADEPVDAWREPWPDRARRWVRCHQTLMAGWAAAIGVTVVALALAVPVLSLAWRNERAARRDERQQRLLALSKADEAQANATKATEEKDRAEQALQFMVQTFRKPDPTIDGRTLKVVELLGHAAEELDSSFTDQPLMKAAISSAIGETFNGLGMHTDALSAFTRTLNIRRAHLGEDHPDTLKSMNNLAMAYQDLGRFDQAIPLIETTLEKRRTKLGANHSDTIESMNDLAVAYWQSGHVKKAIPLFEATLEKVRTSLGEDHTDTLTIMDNLAVACAADGLHDRAITLHKAAISRFKATLGEDNLATLVAINNLARAYQSAGQLSNSIELYVMVLAKLRAKLSDDHPTTLSAMNGLARSYQLAGQIDQAIVFFESTLERRRAKLGRDHPDTLLTSSELATAYVAAGLKDKAISLARAFLQTTAPIRNSLPDNVLEAIPKVTKLLANASEQPTQP
jgi:tetratricopeptide (TPR) repeat protein/tRNA A-37 threonylcarbamoyl transferase component Bud32